MKALIVLLFLSSYAMADSGVIKVERNGKETTYSTDEYVVVKKRKGPKPAPKKLVCPDVKVEVEREVVVEKFVQRNNALSLFVPLSPTGLELERNGELLTSKTYPQLDLGIMYQHDFGRIRATAGITGRAVGILGAGYVW